MSKLYLLTFLLANNVLAGGLEDELMNVTTCVETLVEQFDFHIQHHDTFFARYKNMRDIWWACRTPCLIQYLVDENEHTLNAEDLDICTFNYDDEELDIQEYFFIKESL